ncbi:hypothetical protein QFC21_004771 [Naganishia friedmannii]|uniref:Uncharacterized protein n=1 Tax=Naganishia friedmannii TaxID=89922 RepID=A0ACC2VEH6_9TREE|nr:hypothetical protein QFC21_004771 [Naganishia friedmannii]
MEQTNVLTWLASAGGWYDETAMGLQEYPGMGQGAVALRDLEEDTLLFSVPSSLLLSAEHSDLRTHLSSADWKDLVDAGGWTALIMCMMWEDAQGERSRWYGYMRTLPERFDTPMFWSKDDLRWLKGTDILSKVGKTSAEETYETKIVPLLQKYPEVFTPDSSATHRTIPHFSVDDFHVQGSRMLSRSFSVPKETVKPDPMGDVSMQSAGGDDSVDEGGAAIDDAESESGSATAGFVPEQESQDGEPNESLVEDGNDDDEEEEDDDDDDDSEADVEEEVMVPVADILNAAYGLDNAHLSFDDGRCKMITTKRIAKGEQIYNTYGGPSNSYLLRRYGHIDALPLPSVLLKKLSPELRTWPYGNIADDFEISGQDVLEAVVAHWKQTRKGKVTEQEEQAYRKTLLERVDRWLEASGFGDTFVVEYDVEEALDEMIPFVKLLIMDPATFEAGRAKQKIPKAKIEGDDEAKQVVSILKSVLSTQRQGMGAEAKAMLSALEQHVTEPLPLNQYHAYAIGAAIYRLLYVAEKALDEKLKAAVKTAQEKAKSSNSKKRSHTDTMGGSSKKPKAK